MSDRKPFVLILDSILVYVYDKFNHVHEFVSISELTKSTKDKINCKGITERFLLSLFDSSVMSQIGERVCTLLSLIGMECGKVGGLRKKLKTNSRWSWNSREG